MKKFKEVRQELSEESPLQTLGKKLGKMAYRKEYEKAIEMMLGGKSAFDAAKIFKHVNARELQTMFDTMNESVELEEASKLVELWADEGYSLTYNPSNDLVALSNSKGANLSLSKLMPRVSTAKGIEAIKNAVRDGYKLGGQAGVLKKVNAISQYKFSNLVDESVELEEASYTGTAAKPITWVVSPMAGKPNPKKWVNTEVKAKSKVEAMKLGSKEMGMKSLDVAAVPKFSKEAEMLESVELDEASFEKNLDEKKPVKIKGLKGMNSKQFTKKFKNFAAYEKWADSDAADDVDVQEVMNESNVASMTKTQFKRNEIAQELADEEKNIQKANLNKSKKDAEAHHLAIDGKVWMKGGKPVEFSNRKHAESVGQKMMDKGKRVHLLHKSNVDTKGKVLGNLVFNK